MGMLLAARLYTPFSDCGEALLAWGENDLEFFILDPGCLSKYRGPFRKRIAEYIKDMKRHGIQRYNVGTDTPKLLASCVISIAF